MAQPKWMGKEVDIFNILFNIKSSAVRVKETRKQSIINIV